VNRPCLFFLFLLVCVLPGKAFAASSVDFSGYYTAIYISEHNIGNFSDSQGFADNYFAQRLEINMVFRPTSRLSFNWRLRAPHLGRWGTTDSYVAQTIHGYGQIQNDWGTISIGRLTDRADDYGLANLGYFPVSADWGWAQVAPFDGWSFITALEYSHDWDNGLGLLAQYAKLEGTSAGFDHGSSDIDHDRYVFEPRYKWDSGGLSLGLIYERNANPDGRDAWGNKMAGFLDKTTSFFLNPALIQNFGRFGLHAEAKLGWGKNEIKDQVNIDTEGYGFYLDMDYNYGPGNVTLAGWWVSGTDMEEVSKPHGKSKSLVDMGGGFYPLVIAYNYNAAGWNRLASAGVNTNAIALANEAFGHYVLPNRATVISGGDSVDIPGVINPGLPNQTVNMVSNERWESSNGDTSNHWALSFSGSQALSDDITFRYVASYLRLNKSNYRTLDSYLITAPNTFDTYGYKTQSKELGVEIDLGLSVQLLDNLLLTSTFGYMFTGDAYQSLKGYKIESPNSVTGHKKAQAVWKDSNNSYGWFNTLSFFF